MDISFPLSIMPSRFEARGSSLHDHFVLDKITYWYILGKD